MAGDLVSRHQTLAAFAEGSAALQLGVAVLALDRHEPAAINERIDALGLDRSRLLIGVGAGFSKRPLATMRGAHDELRAAVPGVRLILAAMGPKMCALAGASYDGAFFNWVTPDYAAASGSLVFAPGETTKSITVQVSGDRQAEPNESFQLGVNAVGGNIVGGTGTGTILNDD